MQKPAECAFVFLTINNLTTSPTPRVKKQNNLFVAEVVIYHLIIFFQSSNGFRRKHVPGRRGVLARLDAALHVSKLKTVFHIFAFAKFGTEAVFFSPQHLLHFLHQS